MQYSYFFVSSFLESSSEQPYLEPHCVMKLSIFFAFIGLTFAFEEVEWQQWKTKHSKLYADEAEESVRKLIWQDNYLFVQKHNSENHTFTVETNEFADLVCIKYLASYS